MNQFGSKSCIRNLKQELHILQACSNFFTHRIASNNCYSWKFPKTLAVDVKLEDILLRIVHDKNNLKRNQVYHLLLLELIIDRLLLLIHTTSLWMLGCMNFREQCITIENRLSIETQCKQLTSIVEEFENLISEQSEWPANVGPFSEADNLQIAIYRKDTEAEITHQTLAWLQTIEEEYTKKIEKVSTHKPQCEQKPLCEQSIQTDPIKFDPPEISSHSEDLRILLESVFTCFVHLCSSCNLPSEIGSKLSELDNTSFDTAWNAETQRAGSAVRKDFERLSTYLKHLRERNSQEERKTGELRTELDNAAKELAKKVVELESTKSTHAEQIEHLAKEKKETEKTVAGLKNELAQHQLRGNKLEETVHELRQKLCECETDTSSLTKVLQEKTALIRGQNEEFLTLENTVRELQRQISEAQARNADALEENQRALLEKNNMEIQLSNMRHKHQLLSERIEVLTDKNARQESKEKEYLAMIGDLQEKLKSAEANKTKLAEEYQKQEIMLSELQETSKHACAKTVKLEEGIAELQSTIKRQENKIELLIQYPDLNMSTQTAKHAHEDPLADKTELFPATPDLFIFPESSYSFCSLTLCGVHTWGSDLSRGFSVPTKLPSTMYDPIGIQNLQNRRRKLLRPVSLFLSKN
ncbi:hypothetical protein CRM22_000699 [Opisthorchis felineus]|uniref:Uncharacterized protein n=1 Tax=Opisthorchis felineus TaxID=147828 RepID=A0A4S2MIB6_OPIFE|nr:hypothetical protein CRM22_000699 [Opisthorchis felineus]